MKLFTVLGLIGLALAASPSLRDETKFRAEHQYRYQFNGRIASALPLDPRENAFTNINTDVIIQTERDEEWFTMKLDQVTIYAEQQQKKIERSVRTEEDYDREERKEISPVKIDKEFLQTLSLPVRVHYQNGLISEIELTADEKPWSANIKKAVLNMIQVNILKKSSISESSDYEDSSNTVFKSVERTLEGECQVLYTLVKKSENTEQWTKSVDFEKCQKRPVAIYGMRFQEQCNECDATKKSEKFFSTVSTMETSRNGDDFLIREVELVSRIQFGSVGPQEDEQIMTAEIKNRLSLKETSQIKEKIEWVSKHTEKTNLIYSADMEYAEEKFQMTGDEKYLRQVPLVWKNKEEVVEKLFKKISNDLENNEIQPETSHTMARIVKVVRLTTEQEVRNMEEMLQRFPVEKRNQLLPIWYDSLALAGTKVTLRRVFDKIESSEVSVVKATQIFKMVAEVRFASEEIIDDLTSVCKAVDSRSPVIRQSCWLSLGSVVNALCGDNEDKMISESWKEEKLCPKNLKKRFVAMFMDKVNGATGRYEKVLFLKSLANAGIDTSVVEIEKLIKDRSVEQIVRLQAIEALRRLRSVMPRKIQQVLMSVYRNSQENVEVRISAYNMIIMTRPSSAVLNQIVMELEKERSQQVKSFVYTSLKAVTESELPTDQSWKDRVTKALNSIPEVTRRHLDSRALTLPYSRFANFNFASLFSNDSILPKEVMTSVDTMFAGQWTRYMAQAGIYQHNIDQVITQILSKFEESDFEHLVIRGKRSVLMRPADLLRGMIEKLRISIRQVDQQEPHSMLYFRYKDMDFAFLPMDIDTIPEIVRSVVRNGQIELAEIENLIAKQMGFSYRAAVFVYETTHRIPTTLGLPLVFATKMPTVAGLEGSMKIDLQPKNSDNFFGIKMNIKAQPKVASTHVVKLEVLSPFVTSGVKLLHVAKLNTPIDMEITANWEKQLQLKSVVRTPTKQIQIFHGYSRPATFVRHLKKEIRHYPETADQTIVLRESKYPSHNIHREYFEKTGLKMIVSGQVRESPVSSRWPIFIFGDNTVDITIEPTSQITEVVTTVEAEMFKPTSRMERPSFEDFYGSEEGLLRTETSELKEESEEKRREEFNRYWKNIKTDKAYKYRLFAKMETVGGVRNVRAEGDLTATCEEKLRFCTVRMECRRSVMYEDETRDWKLEVNAQSLYPEQPRNFKDMWTQVHREFHGSVDARWGSSEQQKLSLRILGSQSGVQKKWIKHVDRQQNELTVEEKLSESARLDQYKIIADYEISQYNQWVVRNWFSLIKAYNVLSTSVSPVQNKESRVMVELSIEPQSRRFFSLTVNGPEEKITIEDLKVPFKLPTLNIQIQPETIKEHGIKHIAKHLEKKVRAQCIVKTREVSTFDDTVFRAPLTACFSVLAKDCSAEQPKFAVLMKKSTKTGEEKKIRIISEKNVVEVEKIEGELKINVNGKVIIDLSETDRLEGYGIFVKKSGVVTIDIEHVVVDFDGFEAKIKLSPIFRNKQCGICGHYDGESGNDLRRADNTEVSDSSEIESFHRSFLSEDEECEKDESELSEKANYRLLKGETSSSEEDMKRQETIEPLRRIRMFERGHRVCFSTESVPECPMDTVEEESRSEEIRVKCLDRSGSQAKKLIREIRKKHHNIQEQLSEIEEETKLNIRVPKMCSVY